MKQFFAAVLAFFMMIGSWFGNLFAWNPYGFDQKAVMNKIIHCVETHDAAALEAMACPRLRDRGELLEKIEEMLDCIDGDITESGILSSEGSMRDGGITSIHKGIYFFANERLYNLHIDYDVTTSKNKEKTGISLFELRIGKEDGSGSVLLAYITTFDYVL